MERVPYGPKSNGNLIRFDLQGFGKIREVSKKLTRVPKIVCSRKWPETDVFLRSHKIRNRLARRPTLAVLCLKLWSVRGRGTIRVTKCVILSSGMVDSNSRLEGQRNGP
jgi:hypothetical protein